MARHSAYTFQTMHGGTQITVPSFLTLCSFQLIYGKLFTFFPDKIVFLVALILFEVGSVICASAQSSYVFIIGRAIAGLGSAGINAGYIMYVAISAQRHKRY